MAMKRIALIAVAAGAAMIVHGLAEARGGKSGGGRSHASRSGGWHGGSHFRSRGGAHFRSHGRFRSGGLFVVAPFFGPVYPYYSSYPPPAASPVYYIEKTDGYWYYCTEAGRYYPDVQQCQSPWVPVPAYTSTPAP